MTDYMDVAADAARRTFQATSVVVTLPIGEVSYSRCAMTLTPDRTLVVRSIDDGTVMASYATGRFETAMMRTDAGLIVNYLRGEGMPYGAE